MSNHLVGIIGLPDVRDALEHLGVDLVSGETFAESSRNIREAAKSSSLPVLVEDHKQIGLPQLLSRLPDSSMIAIVRRDGAILDDNWASVSIDSPLSDYLRAVGIGDLDPVFDDITVDENGQIRDALPDLAPPAPPPVASEQGTEPAAQSNINDWLTDAEDLSPATPEEAPAKSDGLHEQPLPEADWLADVPEEAAPAMEPQSDTEVSDAPEDEEDFDGLFPSSTAGGPASRPDTQAPKRPELDPAPTDREPPPARRLVSVPTFSPEPDATDSGPSSGTDALEEDVFDGLPVHDPDLDPEEPDQLDVDNAIDEVAGTSGAGIRRLNAPLGLLLVSYAGKGGVGKSTLAMCIAQAAAEVGGLSVCLIDANRGQGDLGLYMRVRKTDLPSIYDAVMIGDLSMAILSPDEINDVRRGSGDRIGFSFVQAPRPQRGQDISLEAAAVRPEHYAEVISLARRRFDLVIVDTQITEALDTSGLIDHAVGPALRNGGYGMGIVEFSTPGVENLLTSMAYLRNLGADPARMMSLASNVSPTIRDYGKIPQLFGQQSKWKGVVHHDERIYDDMVQRRVPYQVPPMRSLSMEVLASITGMSEFRDFEAAHRLQPTKPWWKRWLGR